MTHEDLIILILAAVSVAMSVVMMIILRKAMAEMEKYKQRLFELSKGSEDNRIKAPDLSPTPSPEPQKHELAITITEWELKSEIEALNCLIERHKPKKGEDMGFMCSFCIGKKSVYDDLMYRLERRAKAGDTYLI